MYNFPYGEGIAEAERKLGPSWWSTYDKIYVVPVGEDFDVRFPFKDFTSRIMSKPNHLTNRYAKNSNRYADDSTWDDFFGTVYGVFVYLVLPNGKPIPIIYTNTTEEQPGIVPFVAPEWKPYRIEYGNKFTISWGFQGVFKDLTDGL